MRRVIEELENLTMQEISDDIEKIKKESKSLEEFCERYHERYDNVLNLYEKLKSLFNIHCHTFNTKQVDTEDEQMYTVSEVARLLNVSRKTVYSHIHAGNINTTQFGFQKRIPKSEYRKFYQKHM